MNAGTDLTQPMARPSADTLHRVVKIAVDNGEVSTIEEAYDLFRTYRLGVRVGIELSVSEPHQAALLTIVNIARRAMLGGVFIEGDLDTPLLARFPGASTLSEAVKSLGGRVVEALPGTMPTLTLGAVSEKCDSHQCDIAVVFRDWRGGVIPRGESVPSETTDAIAPAAVLAGAIAVSEAFQHVRGNPMAGRRSVGMSLWSPEVVDWMNAPAGPAISILPSHLWLIGLGHLGQAYLWLLGLLPYKDPSQVLLMFQDFDVLAKSNDSTSLLTHDGIIGRRKTRAMAEWAEVRGFRTRLVERPFPGGIQITNDEPRVALGGVDNPQARAAYEDAGFDWVVEAGLGAGPIECLAIRLHTFPASTTARQKWGGANRSSDAELRDRPAYKQLINDGADECGLVQMATRTIGVPFVGTVAAALVISELLRQLHGGPTIEVLDMTLSSPATREVVWSSRDLGHLNPGFTQVNP